MDTNLITGLKIWWFRGLKATTKMDGSVSNDQAHGKGIISSYIIIACHDDDLSLEHAFPCCKIEQGG